MDKVYIYEHHQFGDIYLSDKELPPDTLYCSYCDDSDKLLKVCETQEEFDSAMYDLLSTRDLLPCDRYYEYLEKYTRKEE